MKSTSSTISGNEIRQGLENDVELMVKRSKSSKRSLYFCISGSTIADPNNETGIVHKASV